jgi:threonine dehydrogenase-like Zn-dependent dehydrogenase
MNAESPTQLAVNPPTTSKVIITAKTARSNEKMKACVWHGAENMRVEEIAKPAITDPRDIILKVTTTTVCGSDLHMYYDKIPGKKAMEDGDVLGHEFMGIVESVGPQVHKLKVGDRVVVSAVIACGECMYCKKKQFSLCDVTNPSKQLEEMYGHRLSGIFGYSHLTGGYDGGQAEYVRVPLADVNCLRIPDSLPDDKVLFLSDIACTSYHATELGEVTPGKTVCIWGAGPVGLLTAQWCRVRGAKRVISIDNDETRLNLAKKLGAEPLNFSQVDVTKWILENVPNGPEVCIECAGFRFPKTTTHKVETLAHLETDAADIINEMVKTCQKAGNISMIGDYFGYANHFPIGALMEKAITLRGGQVYVQKYWHEVLKKIEEGVFDPTVVITHHMPFEKCAEVYKQFAEHKTLKVVLKTRAGTTAQ